MDVIWSAALWASVSGGGAAKQPAVPAFKFGSAKRPAKDKAARAASDAKALAQEEEKRRVQEQKREEAELALQEARRVTALQVQERAHELQQRQAKAELGKRDSGVGVGGCGADCKGKKPSDAEAVTEEEEEEEGLEEDEVLEEGAGEEEKEQEAEDGATSLETIKNDAAQAAATLSFAELGEMDIPKVVPDVTVVVQAVASEQGTRFLLQRTARGVGVTIAGASTGVPADKAARVLVSAFLQRNKAHVAVPGAASAGSQAVLTRLNVGFGSRGGELVADGVMGVSRGAQFGEINAVNITVFVWCATSADEADTWQSLSQVMYKNAMWLCDDDLGRLHQVSRPSKELMECLRAASVSMQSLQSQQECGQYESPALRVSGRWLAEVPALPVLGITTAAWAELADFEAPTVAVGFAVCRCGETIACASQAEHEAFDLCALQLKQEPPLADFDIDECHSLAHAGQRDLQASVKQLVGQLADSHNILIDEREVDHATRLVVAPGVAHLRAPASQKYDATKGKLVISGSGSLKKKLAAGGMTQDERVQTQGANFHHKYTPLFREVKAELLSRARKKYSAEATGIPLQVPLARALVATKAITQSLQSGGEAITLLAKQGVVSEADLVQVLELVSSAISHARIARMVVALAGNIGVGKSSLIRALLELNEFLQGTAAAVGDGQVLGLLEPLQAFADELKDFLALNKAYDGDGEGPSLEVLQQAVLKLQQTVAAAHAPAPAGMPTVRERSPLCNIAFCLALYAEGKLTLADFKVLLAQFEVEGYLPHTVVFLDEEPAVCSLRASERGVADKGRAAEGDTPVEYFERVSAAHRLLFALPALRRRINVVRTRAPNKTAMEDGDSCYARFVKGPLKELILQAIAMDMP